MSAPLVIVLPGTPVAKGRPRFTRTGHTYTAAKTRAYENALKIAARVAMSATDACNHFLHPSILAGPLAVTILADMPIPKSRRLHGAGHHTKRPDLDNLCKIALDSMNGIVWIDDAQIVQLRATKRYSDTPALTITVSEA